MHGEKVAIPAQILIDQKGMIRWKRVATRVTDRPDPPDVIAEISKL